jgi:hypothetical protein
MSYGEAEVALLKTGAGRHYERLHRAENEAADALSAALGLRSATISGPMQQPGFRKSTA